MSSDRTNRPNLLYVTIDSLRAGYVGAYGAGGPQGSLTPNIDRCAERGVTFERAIAPSMHTTLSFRCMLSGHYPSSFGDWFGLVSPRRPLLAPVFRDNGYRTSAFHSNPFISRYYGFDRGFDVFEDHMPTVSRKPIGRRLLSAVAKIKAVIKEPYENGETLTDAATRHLGGVEEPFFSWVHYMDVHGPYISKQGNQLANRTRAALLWKKALQRPEAISNDERTALVTTYEEEIAFTDRQIGRLLDRVDFDRTIVVITADHGDLLGEHGEFGHSGKLYQGVLHVPLIICAPPGLVARPRREPLPVGGVDFLPTLVELLQLETHESFEGTSFAGLLNADNSAGQRPAVFSEWGRRYLCVQESRWKLIVNYKSNRHELYDLVEDPQEQINRIEEQPDVARRLESLIGQHLQRQTVQGDHVGVEHDEELKARLKALGYMD